MSRAIPKIATASILKHLCFVVHPPNNGCSSFDTVHFFCNTGTLPLVLPSAFFTSLWLPSRIQNLQPRLRQSAWRFLMSLTGLSSCTYSEVKPAAFPDLISSVIALVSVGFLKKSPNHRPFSPVDPDISFPYVEREKVSSGLLVVISLIIPAVITALIALIFTPGPTTSRDIPKYTIWRKKLWEWNTAWMGLGLGLALTYFFTEGLKDLIGKPRPDLLSRCNLDPATVQQYALGGYGGKLPLWNALVSYTACNQPDVSKLNDGFASFPSGHAARKRSLYCS